MLNKENKEKLLNAYRGLFNFTQEDLSDRLKFKASYLNQITEEITNESAVIFDRLNNGGKGEKEIKKKHR